MNCPNCKSSNCSKYILRALSKRASSDAPLIVSICFECKLKWNGDIIIQESKCMPIDPMIFLDTFNLLVKFGTAVLDKMPNYNQRKKNQYHDLISSYNYENNLPPRYRDDQKIDDLRQKIAIFLQALSIEVEKESEAKKDK